MTGADLDDLERGYRRWLRWYPRSFRREHEAEILGVLLAGAAVGQRQPAPMECLDLLRSALWMRLRPSVPRSNRSVFAAVKLMCLGAVVELAAAVTMLVTIDDVRSNVITTNPGLTHAQWQAVVAGQLAPKVAAAGIAVGIWLWMAWAIGRGHRWTRIVVALFFAVNAVDLLNGIAHGSAVYARPALAIGIVLCLVEVAAVALSFHVRLPADAGQITPGAGGRAG